MPFERQIRTVELQQKAGADDRLVFLAQGGAEVAQIFRLPRIILVFHCPGDDPRRRGGDKGLDKPRTGIGKGGAKIGDLGLDRRPAEIAHRSQRLGRPILLTAWRAASCSSMIRRKTGYFSASARVRRCQEPPKPLMRWRICRKKPSRCCSPLLAMSTSASACLLTIQRSASWPSRSSSPGSTDSPRARRTCSPVNSGGRGRLPVCVVRMRSSLRRMVASPLPIACPPQFSEKPLRRHPVDAATTRLRRRGRRLRLRVIGLNNRKEVILCLALNRGRPLS